MVNQLLSLCLSQNAIGNITLNIDIQESGYTANTHGSTVLSLDSTQIAKVQPLYSLASILCRSGNIKAVGSCHFLQTVESTNLLCQLLTKTHNIISHNAVATNISQIFLLEGNQLVNTIEGNTTIVAYNTATTVGIRQTGNNMAATSKTHLWSISIKYSLIVSLVILGKNLMESCTWLIAIVGAGLLSHLDTAIRHESSLQRLVSLKTNNLLQILQALVNITWSMGGKTGYYISIHVQNAIVLTLLLLQLLELSPQLISCISRICQEALITIKRLIVFLYKITHINLFTPEVSGKSIPLLIA